MEHVYRCGNCGAQLQPAPNEREMRCAFCEAVTARDPEPPVAREEPREEASKSREPKRTARDYGFLAFVVPLLAGLVAGAYAYLRTTRDWVGEPILSDVDGDGVEDVVGQWVETTRDNPTKVLGVVDGKSRRIVWSLTVDPSRGGSTAFPMALADGVVVMGASKPEAQIVETRTGKLLATVDLPGRAGAIQAHGGLAWIDTEDGKGVEVDLHAGRMMAGTRPDWAPRDTHQTCPHAICRPSSTAPAIADMNVVEVRVDGASDDAIAVGRKENGTPLPMLAGFSLSKKTVTWTHVFASPATSDGGTPLRMTLSRGRAYFEYEDAKVYRVAAVSVATGQVVWDVKRDDDYRGASSITAGASLYVAVRTKLRILDPQTGATVSTLF